MSFFKKPELMLVFSMVIFGTLAPFVRNIAVSSGELALYRAVMATVLIGLFLLITKQKIPFALIKKDLPLLVFSGMAMGINWVLLFEAYKYTTVSAATLSYYFAPVLVMLICPFLFKEKMGPKQIICFIMSSVGIVMITGVGNMSEGSSHITGIAFGLGAAVFYASVVLINKFIKNVSGIHRTFLQFVSAIFVLLPYVMLTGGITLSGVDKTGWICLIVVGVVHTGITYCMYFSSLKGVAGQQAAILSYVDPLVAVIVSVTVLNEKMTVLQAVGGALILGFTLWNEINPKRK